MRGVIVGVDVAVLRDATVGRRGGVVMLGGVGGGRGGEEPVCGFGAEEGVVCLLEGVYPRWGGLAMRRLGLPGHDTYEEGCGLLYSEIVCLWESGD